MKTVLLAVCISLCCVVIRGNAAEAGSYGPVKENETLYRIALKYQQPGVSAAQVMMSIFRANPDAFAEGNINRLRQGAILQIPDSETIANTNPDQAFQEASDQIDAYARDLPANTPAGGAVTAVPDSVTDNAPGLETQAAEGTPAAVEPTAAPLGEVDLNQSVEEASQGLAANQQQTALPEPKPPKARRKSGSKSAPFRYSYDISYINDDNVRLAQDNDDVRSDEIYSAKIKATGGMSLDSFSIWNYGGSASYNKYNTYDKLDHYDFEFNTRYRFALSSGFTAPIYSLRAKVGGRDYDSKMRDATFYGVSADLNKWLTNTINMTTGFGYNGQESESEVYDTEEFFIFANLDTNFTKTDLVYTTVSYISGDTVSSSTPSLDVINVADAIEPDDAFGGIDANQFAYRIEADTWVGTIGYNRILTRDVSLDFSVRYVDSTAKDDSSISYDRTIWRASLLGRF